MNLVGFIIRKICTACSRTSYKIVPLTNLNKYLHNDTGETEVNISISVNNGREKILKKTHPLNKVHIFSVTRTEKC